MLELRPNGDVTIFSRHRLESGKLLRGIKWQLQPPLPRSKPSTPVPLILQPLFEVERDEVQTRHLLLFLNGLRSHFATLRLTDFTKVMRVELSLCHQIAPVSLSFASALFLGSITRPQSPRIRIVLTQACQKLTIRHAFQSRPPYRVPARAEPSRE